MTEYLIYYSFWKIIVKISLVVGGIMLLRGNVGPRNVYERGVDRAHGIVIKIALVVDKLATFGLFLYFGAFLVG